MIKLKRLNWVTLIIVLILTVNLYGCTNGIAANINGIDDNNIIKTIDTNGFYEDSCGYKFNTYIKSEHFEIYYSSLQSSNKEYVNSSIIELENSYPDVLDFFNLDEKDIPIVKIYLYGEDEVALHNIFEKELENSYEGLVGRYVKSNSIYAVNKTNLVYDFTDCVILTYAGSKKIPEWLLEGTASYLTENEDGYIVYYGDFAEYETIDFHGLENDNKQGYMYGYSYVNSIIEKYGEDKLKKLIKSYGDVEKTLDITKDELFNLWKEYVSRNALDNVYGIDETDVTALIDNNGYYEDEGGNIFDSYVKSEHFEIYFDSKSYNSEKRANRTINHLEDNYDKIINIFNISESEIPIVKINMYSQYMKYANFCKAMNYNVAIQSVAIAPFGNRIYISFDNDVDTQENDDEMNNRLTAALHEFIHNVHINKTGKKYIPHWLMDGVAMYYSQQSDMYGKTHYSKMLEEEFPSIEDLTVYKGDNFWTPYMYGYTMIEYILQEYGEEKLLEVINEYGDIEEVLEISYEEFT